MRYFTSIFITIAVAALGFIGISHYVDTAYGQSSDLVKVETTAGASTADGAQVLALLNRLSGISLDGSIFVNPVFKSLQDFGISIAPQEVGRPNPYLPTNVTGTEKPKTAGSKISTPQFLLR